MRNSAEPVCTLAIKLIRTVSMPEKISLIKSLNFALSENQLLELIIGDIVDIEVKTAAFNGNLGSVSDLLVLLGNYATKKIILLFQNILQKFVIIAVSQDILVIIAQKKRKGGII